jgi:hypothetical protein
MSVTLPPDADLILQASSPDGRSELSLLERGFDEDARK